MAIVPCGNLQWNSSMLNDSSEMSAPWNTSCADNVTDTYEYYDWDNYFDTTYLRKLQNWAFPMPHEWVLIASYFVVFTFALFGNLLVCYAVLKNPQMRTVTNYYILNLSIADVLVSLICLPVTVVLETSETWFFGDLACKLIPYFQVVSMSVSVLTLCAIAVDRYFAICQPLMFKSTAKRAVTVIGSIWLTSFLIPIPQAVVYRTEAPEYPRPYIYFTRCYERDWYESIEQKFYHVALVMVIYVIPLVLVSVAYILVCKQLWSAIPGSCETKDKTKVALNESSASKAAISQLKSRRKVAKMLIVVVIIFAVCYLPLHLLNILRQFPVFEDVDDAGAQRKSIHTPFLIAHWLAFANSAVNPIIYNFLSAKFRKEFQAAFACCCCCKNKRLESRRRRGYRSSIMNSSTVSNSKTYTENINLATIKNNTSVCNDYSQV
ncbi:orexin receptor type 2-like [Glandiceps talaboti]